MTSLVDARCRALASVALRQRAARVESPTSKGKTITIIASFEARRAV